MIPLEKKIILASKSPRRSQLLKAAGFQFEVKALEVDESFSDDLKKEEVAEHLAIRKAEAAKSFLKGEDIILAADSIVLLNGIIYGKPKDRSDAQNILRALSGQKHQVITGVCLLSKDKQVSFSGVSDVYMRSLSAAEIDYYIDHFQPYDKAGAYAIQEWIGLCKIERIEGTYSNIMGLPVELVYRHLEAF